MLLFLLYLEWIKEHLKLIYRTDCCKIVLFLIALDKGFGFLLVLKHHQSLKVSSPEADMTYWPQGERQRFSTRSVCPVRV